MWTIEDTWKTFWKENWSVKLIKGTTKTMVFHFSKLKKTYNNFMYPLNSSLKSSIVIFNKHFIFESALDEILQPTNHFLNPAARTVVAAPAEQWLFVHGTVRSKITSLGLSKRTSHRGNGGSDNLSGLCEMCQRLRLGSC